MAIPNVMNTGHSGMMAAKVAIATTGHNITNANTEGFSRQRVEIESAESRGGQLGHNTIGMGAKIARVERLNDEYIEKQIRNAQRELSHYEEKDIVFKQVEDIFNEMNGEGLSRLVSRFFNEFRKLSNEPENPAVREAVREASQALVNDFHRIRSEVNEVRRHLDSRITGYASEATSLARQITQLNHDINLMERSGGSPNDLLDKRDLALRKLSSLLDISTHKDSSGHCNVEIKNVGPLVTGVSSEILSVISSPRDNEGKLDQSVDITFSGGAMPSITHLLKGGKLGALVEFRDVTVTSILEKIDQLAFDLSTSVNEIHQQGFTKTGRQGVSFFQPMDQLERAAEFIQLSDEVRTDSGEIATAAIPNSPGDNRIALAISKLQYEKILENGTVTLDEYYNSIVSSVGVANAKNRFVLNQQKDIMTQLGKVRDQISGVSIDEETANLLQFQHAFDASAKVIQVADEMLKTVLSLKRD